MTMDRYYVDPSTIRHSLSSTTSSTASAEAAAGVAAKTSSGMIGTTIQLHNKNRGVQRSANSASPQPQPPQARVSVAKPTSVLPPPAFSSNVASLAGLAVPAPAVDPFASSAQAKPSSVAAAFAAFPPSAPTATTATTNPAAPGPATHTKPKFEENFANFDAAVFDSSAVAKGKGEKRPSTNAKAVAVRANISLRKIFFVLHAQIHVKPKQKMTVSFSCHKKLPFLQTYISLYII